MAQNKIQKEALWRFSRIILGDIGGWIIIIIISSNGMVTCEKWIKKSYLETFWNGNHVDEEETEDPWIQEVTTGMREKGIDSIEWIDKEEWRRKI